MLWVPVPCLVPTPFGLCATSKGGLRSDDRQCSQLLLTPYKGPPPTIQGMGALGQGSHCPLTSGCPQPFPQDPMGDTLRTLDLPPTSEDLGFLGPSSTPDFFFLYQNFSDRKEQKETGNSRGGGCRVPQHHPRHVLWKFPPSFPCELSHHSKLIIKYLLL